MLRWLFSVSRLSIRFLQSHSPKGWRSPVYIQVDTDVVFCLGEEMRGTDEQEGDGDLSSHEFCCTQIEVNGARKVYFKTPGRKVYIGWIIFFLHVLPVLPLLESVLQ